MTFESSAWAIDGALLGSSLARRAEYAAVGGAEGIVQADDLKVTQLAVPGVGVLISAGVGLVNNQYQTNPNETYVVSNPSTHTIPSAQMPAASSSARSFIVAVVVGDPAFSQAGHPWMSSSDPAPGTETTFQYVRPTLIEVPAGTTTLDVNYPALPLARIDIPASTTTITDGMITDLRRLARPRSDQTVIVSGPAQWTNDSPSYIPTSWGPWGTGWAPSVKIPSWAKRAVIIGFVNGVRFKDNSVNVGGALRVAVGSIVGPNASFDFEVDTTPGGGQFRENFMAAASLDVSSVAGTTQTIRIQGLQNAPSSPTNNQRLRLQAGSQQIIDIRFFEE